MILKLDKNPIQHGEGKQPKTSTHRLSSKYGNRPNREITSTRNATDPITPPHAVDAKLPSNNATYKHAPNEPNGPTKQKQHTTKPGKQHGTKTVNRVKTAKGRKPSRECKKMRDK